MIDRRFVVRVLLSVTLLAALLWMVDIRRTLELLRSASLASMVAILVVLTLDRLLMAFKWWLLLESAQLDIGLLTAIRAYYISSFAGLFLPMTVGADVVRTVTLREHGSTAPLVATIALERGIGALAQGILCGVSLALIFGYGLQPDAGLGTGPLAIIVGAVLVVGAAGLPLSFRVADRVADLLRDRGGIASRLAEFSRSYADARHQRGVVWTFLALTLLEGLLPILVHWLAARGLGFDLPFLLFVATIPIVYLVGRLPISLGGIGVVEGSFVALAAMLGIGTEQAFSIAVLCQVGLVVVLLPGLAAFLWKRPREAREIG